MFAQSLRALPGAIVSLMLVTAPAYADLALDTKHRVAQLRQRIAQAARSARGDRHVRATHSGSAAAATESSSATDDGSASASDDNVPPLDRQVFESGIASWYGPWFNGRATSSGRRFNQNDLTAAHPWLPLGSQVRVRLVGTPRSVDVTVTDRPGNKRRIIDLSREAARRLGMVHRGTALVALSHL